MRTKENDMKYIELLKAFQKAQEELSAFYLDEDTNSDYSHMAPNFYPFNSSFDEYTKPIKNWIAAQISGVKMEPSEDLAKSRRFCFDDGEIFQGYTFGSLWNGWECPYFEHDTALKIAKFFSKNGSFLMTYDSETDAFLAYDECNGDTERFEAQTIKTVNGEKKVYDIGAWAWCWLDADAQYE